MFNLHLPTVEMIAGDTCPMMFKMSDMTRMEIEFGSCTAHLSISPYVNESDDPVFEASTTQFSDGVLTFEIDPVSTINLRGKYIYQLYLSNGRENEIYEGHLIIYANRNKNVVVR